MKITKDNILLGKNPTTKLEAMELVANQLKFLGLVKDGYLDSMQNRDEDITVFLGNGVAIPHGQRDDADLVLGSGIVILPLRNPIKWEDDEDDEDVSLVIGIAANSSEHLEILKNISRLLTIHKDKVALFANNQNITEITNFFNQEEEKEEVKQSSHMKKIVAITACPTGVAHTFMAATALEDFGKANGYQIKVETQGSDGQQNAITAQEVSEADAVIIACDVKVDLSRFQGKKVFNTSTKYAMESTENCFNEALNAKVLQSDSDDETFMSVLKNSKTHLMSGVSNIIPIVVIGGILIAFAIALSGVQAGKGANITNPFLIHLSDIGGSAFSMMVPVLAGYIAFSIAGKPGLAPGLTSGVIATAIKAGFLGGIVGGFIAGFIAWYINKNVKLPKNFITIKTIFLIPIVTSVITGLLMYYVLGQPITLLMESMTNGLASMTGGNRVILGVILGAMISVDMGGPINKVAFLFGVAMIKSDVFTVMGSCAVAICIPPLSLGIHSIISKKLYNKEEQEAGKGALLMGLIGITEGAIPFAVSDPLRVIPSIVFGSAIGGGIAGYFGVADHAPHGGPIVTPVVDNVGGFAIAIIVGILCSCIALQFLKKYVKTSKHA